MWVRIMDNPGGAQISRIATIPVAVDVHVRRVTENLGVTATQGLPLNKKIKQEIQSAWHAAVPRLPESGLALCGIKYDDSCVGALDYQAAEGFLARHGGVMDRNQYLARRCVKVYAALPIVVSRALSSPLSGKLYVR